ncbi:helicase RepA family protein [Planktomarina temperata]|nr:helicase RepA family protein [Planktomarina temperata]MDC1335541.1 helicase RepA family protein [Planktomarina temperata]
MPIISLEAAKPIMSARAEQLKQAIVTAADVKVDLTNDCIIKNWLGENAISVVYGDSNCGKSFFAVDLAYHVAAGQNWFGQKVRTGNVLYVAAEGGRGFGKRIAAVELQKPDLHAAGSQNLNLLPLQVDLHGAEDASAIINQAEPSQYSLVVVDTLAMSMGEGSENDGRDMGMFISNIMRLKAYFNCHILIVHHTGKDRSKGARGHSSLRAALDTEIELKADGLVRIASVTKQRDMENGRKVAFTLEVVELGSDEDLDAVTSCVVSPADVPDSTAKRTRLVGLNQVAHQALHDALKMHGRKIGNSEHYPSSRQVVEASLWYDGFKLRRSDDAKPDAVRKSFNRARDWLQANDYIREYENKIWFIDDPDGQDK